MVDQIRLATGLNNSSRIDRAGILDPGQPSILINARPAGCSCNDPDRKRIPWPRMIAAAFFAGLLLSAPSSSGASGDENWDQRFGYPGFDGVINGIAPRNGDVFVSGGFTTVGPTGIEKLAQWDGMTWSAPGGGITGSVRGIKASSSGVYVIESRAGHSGEWTIARWDGINWFSYPPLLGGIVDLAVEGEDVYVAEHTGNVRRWNGNEWTTLAENTIEGGINTLLVADGRVYAGGSFASTGDLSNIGNIVVWAGEDWTNLGSGVNGPVDALAIIDEELYVGGRFTMAGGVTAHGIAKWHNGSWHSLGDGLTGTIREMSADSGGVYVAGDLILPGEEGTVAMARWDGRSWSTFHPPNTAIVRTMETSDGLLYVAGGVRNTDGPDRIHVWDGSCWSTLDSGMENGLISSINALATAAGGVFVGGNTLIGKNLWTPGVARWTGTNWSNLSDGLVGGTILSMTAHEQDLYVGGSFTESGSLRLNRVGKWDGTEWSNLGAGLSSLGSGITGTPHSLGAWQRSLVVGGRFSDAGTQPSLNFAIWHLPPRLDIRRSGGEVHLTWHQPHGDFSLESAARLDDDRWEEVLSARAVTNQWVTIQDLITQTDRFYRLRRR